MGNKQYVKFDCGVLQALSKIKLSGIQTRIINLIAIESWGWNKEECCISNSEIAEKIGVARKNMIPELNKLIEFGVVLKKRLAKEANILKINKDVSVWKILHRGLPSLKKETTYKYQHNISTLCMRSGEENMEKPKNEFSMCAGDDDIQNLNNFFKMFPGQQTIQTFSDRDTNPKMARLVHIENGIDEKTYNALIRLNHQGAGIYFTVNETDGLGRRGENIKRVRAVFADLDGSPLDAVMQYLPSLVVESSPGKFHCYWFVEDIPLAAFTPMQENIARIFNSDPKVKDLPRVLRVPGFWHCKKEPFMVRVHSGSGNMHTYRQLVEMFPPEKKQQWSAKKYQVDNPRSNVIQFTGNYGTLKGNRNNHIFRRVCGMLAAGKGNDYIQAEVMREANSCVPPMPETEAMQILKSAQKYRH